MGTNINTLTTNLKNTREKLERLEKERDDRIAKLTEEVKSAVKRGADDFTIQRSKGQLSAYDALNRQAIERVKEQLAALEDEAGTAEAKRRMEASAKLAGQKAKALQAWVNNGGNEQGFSDAWPEMEREILKQKALEALDG